MDKLTMQARIDEVKFSMLYAVMQLSAINALILTGIYFFPVATIKLILYVLGTTIDVVFFIACFYQKKKGEQIQVSRVTEAKP